MFALPGIVDRPAVDAWRAFSIHGIWLSSARRTDVWLKIEFYFLNLMRFKVPVICHPTRLCRSMRHTDVYMNMNMQFAVFISLSLSVAK